MSAETPIPEDIRRSLAELLETHRPANLLLVAPRGTNAFDERIDKRLDLDVQRLDRERLIERLTELGRFDLAFVIETVEHMDKEAAVKVLARLRDVHARRLYVLAPIGVGEDDQASRWEDIDFWGYGFTRVGRYERDGHPLHLYGFDIDHYKITPDWLNAKYWANPELFGKYRW
ncbi:MAG: hypothetical protein GWN84_06350 [Gammaproteobacteria bacterium]|nr:hypothetical protein [Gammaproteobacteria bacterium]NIR81782.1 hypothetical protein [Gammaproteobacteria bacterium]NIU02889.1 hypothetical protein [Gammaproteobacteria bacterium]NIV50411.1 hypothetical protein [Gammaproteobacteria bacterium]NIV73788.1 hypothetical protein [Gammaproteobacteria bacterium]